MSMRRRGRASTILGVAAILALACHPGAGRDDRARDPRALAAARAAFEAVAQYDTARREGHKVAACLGAGKAAEAFLKANNASQYKTWKRTEERDCKTIGFPF